MAEVLITLGIIGVVAALTLPSVINNTKNKELEAAFKKSYSNLSNAVQRMYLEDYSGSRIDGGLDTIINNLQKYYVKSSACTNGNTNCPTTVFPIKTFSDSTSAAFLQNNYKSYLGQRGASLCNDGIMAVADGSFLYFDFAAPGEPTYGKYLICVDVNGWRKKPNKFGHDFFVFQLDFDNGRLLPAGAAEAVYSQSQYCSLSSSLVENGYGCTKKALSDKDYFKNLPK